MDKLGETGMKQVSLTGSGTEYRVVQIRVPESGVVRMQGFATKKWETSFHASDKLCDYVSKLTLDRPSQAGTQAMYAGALARREYDGTESKVRLQIPGPELNRKWGAVVVVTAPDAYGVLPDTTVKGG